MHSTDQYEQVTIDHFAESKLDKGLQIDIEEKDAEIKSLREQIEQMNTRTKVEIIEDPIELFINQLQQEKIEMEEYLKSMKKPKKKQVDKVQLKKDLFELDFMCE